MRCQWGTTWDNMQPWIVARRYREFDVLNFQVIIYESNLCSIFSTILRMYTFIITFIS